ncbi:hypothetical protein BC567DRAFT_268618, partial [Phyllosticta citribraziliensis]
MHKLLAKFLPFCEQLSSKTVASVSNAVSVPIEHASMLTSRLFFATSKTHHSSELCPPSSPARELLRISVWDAQWDVLPPVFEPSAVFAELVVHHLKFFDVWSKMICTKLLNRLFQKIVVVQESVRRDDFVQGDLCNSGSLVVRKEIPAKLLVIVQDLVHLCQEGLQDVALVLGNGKHLLLEPVKTFNSAFGACGGREEVCGDYQCRDCRANVRERPFQRLVKNLGGFQSFLRDYCRETVGSGFLVTIAQVLCKQCVNGRSRFRVAMFCALHRCIWEAAQVHICLGACLDEVTDRLLRQVESCLKVDEEDANVLDDFHEIKGQLRYVGHVIH